ncbi:N-acetylmuramoyl-L-alanine amidase [Candidatus Azambacteria bacterium]|nr:N-acetylmuramoyl-L-alanine amidase [Candidatus Azambacteria bacterium]MBI3685235.1 N-acetylmuramoyl-L-alanine amidase [Candidatus Azambacteria bacterium]
MLNNIYIIIFALVFAAFPFAGSAGTYADSDVPLILPRETWENSAALSGILQWAPEDKDANSPENGNPNSNEAIPDYAPVERIVIHDAGCPPSSSRCNSDTVNPIEVIQSIYRNHAVIRGWGDIGYQYIVDRKGNIYEARYGGNGARGAHVYDSKTCRNFNVGTIGIVLLGNYANTQVPAAAFASLSKLVGWLSATNGIQPAELSKTTLIWANPKLNGKCDPQFGSFSSSFTGPVVLGHKEIEVTNSDPGVLDMSRLRQEASVWKEKYAGLHYVEQGTSQVFDVVGGVIKKLTNTGDQAVAINSNQLYLFPEENKTVLPDGTLIKSRTRGEIYKIEDGKRRHITSAVLFKRLGYSLGDVRVLSDRELLGYAKGNPIVFPDGTLLASAKSGKTYLVGNGGKKRHILSQKIFQQRKFKQKNVVSVFETELEEYPSDGVVGLPDNTLVSLSYKASAPNYVIADGGRKLIPSWEMFDRWKFSRTKIAIISQKDFDLYPDKGELLLPNGTLVRAAPRPELYAVFGGKKHWITQYDILQKSGFKIAKTVQLSVENLARYPDGPAVAAPEDWKNITQGKVPVAQKISVSLPSEEQQSSDRNIRIGLFSVSEDENVSVSANGAFKTFFAGGGQKEYGAGDIAVVNWKMAGNTTFTAQSDGTIFTVASYSLYNWNKSVNFNSFRGNLELAYSPVSKKVWMVNELPLEKYLAGIGEALNSDHPEYQKAFAVAARSYALFHLDNGGKYKGEVFHLGSTSSDQVYKGYGWEQYAPKLVQAQEATAGEAMKYNGKIARAVYSSDSGGVTKNACTAFGGEFCSPDYAYLSGGVRDPEGTIRRDAAVQKASHGVGMSAAGARRLAELGKTYKDILAYYYKGVSVEKAY